MNLYNEGRGDEIIYHDAPERPEKLEADVHEINRNRHYNIIVGKLDGKPYEVFVLSGELLPNHTSEDYLVEKMGSREYGLLRKEKGVGERYLIRNILQYSLSSNIDVLTRFTSQLMRHGVKMDYIVEQVRKADITINDFSKILGDVLSQYCESDDVLPECNDCGSENVKFVEGCYVCESCGSSRCG